MPSTLRDDYGAVRNDEEVVTVGELADRLKVSRRQIYKLIDAGALPALRLGPRLYRIPASSVTKLFVDLRVEV